MVPADLRKILGPNKRLNARFCPLSVFQFKHFLFALSVKGCLVLGESKRLAFSLVLSDGKKRQASFGNRAKNIIEGPLKNCCFIYKLRTSLRGEYVFFNTAADG